MLPDQTCPEASFSGCAGLGRGSQSSCDKACLPESSPCASFCAPDVLTVIPGSISLAPLSTRGLGQTAETVCPRPPAERCEDGGKSGILASYSSVSW